MTQEYSRIVTALFMAPTGPPRGGMAQIPAPILQGLCSMLCGRHVTVLSLLIPNSSLTTIDSIRNLLKGDQSQKSS